MQEQFLQIYAPNSLHLLYRPHDTGNPGFDMGEHIARNSHRRIDLESTQLIGNRVIGHIEHALGPADEAEQQHRILTVPYAEKQLGSTPDAAELIRVIKEAVSAGVEADPRSLQIYASWAYEQCKTRPVGEVLKQLAMMAMEMTSITATHEEQLEDEPEVIELSGPVHCFTDVDPTGTKEQRQREARHIFEQRCEEILDQRETTDPFASELRSITDKLPRHHSVTNLRDEEVQFQEYLSDLADHKSDETLEALQDSHERVTEQYDEGGVVSLHMSESERFIVDGTLDDDVDATYLPSEAAVLVDEMREMFTSGIPFFSNDPAQETIEGYLAFRLNQIYGDPSDERNRTPRTMRGIGTSKNGLFEYVYTVSAYPNREERQYVTEVLEQIMENMKRDFILNTMNRSATFRRFMTQIEHSTDPRELRTTIQEAYKARQAGTLTIKMFTALTAIYRVTIARLDSTPVRTEVEGRTYVKATSTINLALAIPTKDLRQLATQLQSLPSIDREPVRTIFRHNRESLYNRIRDGLSEIVRQASPRKLMYLRYALFEDPTTGKANEPQNMIHLLCRDDRTAIWKQLQEATRLAQPKAA